MPANFNLKDGHFSLPNLSLFSLQWLTQPLIAHSLAIWKQSVGSHPMTAMLGEKLLWKFG
jgi:hypothetical protein